MSRASFAVEIGFVPNYPPDVPNYYVLMYLEFLHDTKTQAGHANRLIGTPDASKVALQILERVEADEKVDLRLRDWRHICTRTSTTCNHTEHSQPHKRDRKDFAKTPNSRYYTRVKPGLSLRGESISEELAASVIAGFRSGKLDQLHCVCASENTIMLCNNQSHVHSAAHSSLILAEPESEDEFRERAVTGAYNQNIVAVDVFGEKGSLERWMVLKQLVSQLYVPTHGAELCNTFDQALAQIDDETNSIRCCMAQFTYSTYAEAIGGKTGDREMPLLEHSRYRLRRSGIISATDTTSEHLDWFHPHRSRINARNAILMTMAILLFAESTDWRVWRFTAWSEWSGIVVRHCRECMTCRASMIEGLSFVFFCAALHPVSKSMIANLEQLLALLLLQRPK